MTALNRPGSTVTKIAYAGVWGAGSQLGVGPLSAKQGIYDITVNTSGTLFNPATGNGFKCIYLTDGTKVIDCLNYHAGSNIYTFYAVDLNGAPMVNIFFSTDNCSVVNPIGVGSLTTPQPAEDH
jgi:hypothetical protein